MLGRQYQFPQLAEQRFHVHIADEDSCGVHGHDFLEFSYVTSGAMEHHIGDRVERLSAGDYFIVDYGTEHAYRRTSLEPLQVVNLLFYPEFLERTLAGRHSFSDVMNSFLLRMRYQSLTKSPTGQTFQDRDGQLRRMLREMIGEYRCNEAGSLEYIRCLLVQMLILTLRKITGEVTTDAASPEMEAVAAHIRECYAQPLQLQTVARELGYAPSYLSRRFSREMGEGFSEYLQRIRVEQSCRLLESTTLRVGQIAPMVGYDDLKFFNQVFRKVLGITPRQFRANLPK